MHTFSSSKKCIIIDNDQQSTRQCTNFIRNHPHLKCSTLFTYHEHAIGEIQKHEQIFFLFLDITHSSSIVFEIAKKYRSKTEFIVFTSKDSDYAIDAFQAGGDQYLLKPLQFAKCSSLIDGLILKKIKKNQVTQSIISKDNWLRIPTSIPQG